MTPTPETNDPFGPDAWKTHSTGCICPDCEGNRQDERALRATRQRSALMISGADQALAALECLDTLLNEMSVDEMYAEFYSDGDGDTDAVLELQDAARSVRAFRRIARERAARTEQQP